MAHDRCARAVEDLLDQEEDFEEELLRDLHNRHYDYQYSYGSHSHGSQYKYYTSSSSNGYPHERRPSMVH
jgi:hypothetical protein